MQFIACRQFHYGLDVEFCLCLGGKKAETPNKVFMGGDSARTSCGLACVLTFIHAAVCCRDMNRVLHYRLLTFQRFQAKLSVDVYCEFLIPRHGPDVKNVIDRAAEKLENSGQDFSSVTSRAVHVRQGKGAVYSMVTAG